ncbi:MAG: repeat protein [Phycisphaerales bacterium]|nr:repeat protein [Phycisphaerales bacterium]
MRTFPRFALAAVTLLPAITLAQEKPFPAFRMQEIDRTLKIGYGVLLVDLNGDSKPDIVVADKERVIWFENPSWQMHTILAGQTLPDNVCLDAIDIDGDGKPDLVLGAGWKGYDTKSEGALQWLARGKDVNEPWTLHPIGKEVDIHRLHVADVDGSGKPRIIVAPLLGKGATAADNWLNASPRLLEFTVPKDPANGPWEPAVVTDALHVMHNFTPVNWPGEKGISLLVASYEGVHRFVRKPDGSWVGTLLCKGDQSNPQASRGCSEVKLGRGPGGKPLIATIEPWHGNQVVAYTPSAAANPGAPVGSQPIPWDRHVLDDTLKGGHGVWCADLDGDGVDEIIACSREPLDARTGPGINTYRLSPAAPASPEMKWEKHVLDNKGVAAEDMAAVDLNGDGRVDIVAVGRATHNVRIYWNEEAGKK